MSQIRTPTPAQNKPVGIWSLLIDWAAPETAPTPHLLRVLPAAAGCTSHELLSTTCEATLDIATDLWRPANRHNLPKYRRYFVASRTFHSLECTTVDSSGRRLSFAINQRCSSTSMRPAIPVLMISRHEGAVPSSSANAQPASILPHVSQREPAQERGRSRAVS